MYVKMQAKKPSRMMEKMLKERVAKDASDKEESEARTSGRTKRIEAERSFLTKGPGFRSGLAYSSMLYKPKWAEPNKGGIVPRRDL